MRNTKLFLTVKLFLTTDQKGESLKKKKILVICPTMRDRKELSAPALSTAYDIIFHEYNDEVLIKMTTSDACKEQQAPNHIAIINEIVSTYQTRQIDGILCTNDYPGTMMASVIASHLQKNGPLPHSILCCEHKYYSRILQKKLYLKPLLSLCLSTLMTQCPNTAFSTFYQTNKISSFPIC